MKKSFNHTSYNNFEKQLSNHILTKYLSYVKGEIVKKGFITEEMAENFIIDFMIKNEDLFYTNKLK